MEAIHRLVHITSADVYAFSLVAEDFNPIHMDDAAAHAAGFEGRICHGALLTAIISGMIAKEFPGAIWMEHNIQFKRAALVGQTVEFVLTLDETVKKPAKTLGILNVEVKNTAGSVLAISRNVVLLPAQTMRDAEKPPVQPPQVDRPSVT